mmetsp:Transcript_21247/g.41674  ORF Transcript_21247/g.41674 Transcript_21247/m.41674 type:complete len:242 (+) Transcript_21247:446-1171(+)
METLHAGLDHVKRVVADSREAATEHTTAESLKSREVALRVITGHEGLVLSKSHEAKTLVARLLANRCQSALVDTTDAFSLQNVHGTSGEALVTVDKLSLQSFDGGYSNHSFGSACNSTGSKSAKRGGGAIFTAKNSIHVVKSTKADTGLWDAANDHRQEATVETARAALCDSLASAIHHALVAVGLIELELRLGELHGPDHASLHHAGEGTAEGSDNGILGLLRHSGKIRRGLSSFYGACS